MIKAKYYLLGSIILGLVVMIVGFILAKGNLYSLIVCIGGALFATGMLMREFIKYKVLDKEQKISLWDYKPEKKE